jgi:hypothetical protein
MHGHMNIKFRRFHLRRESKSEIRLDFLVVDKSELFIKDSINKRVTVWCFLAVHHSIDLFNLPTLMHNSFIH